MTCNIDKNRDRYIDCSDTCNRPLVIDVIDPGEQVS